MKLALEFRESLNLRFIIRFSPNSITGKFNLKRLIVQINSMNVLYLTSWYPNRKDRLDGNFIQNHVRALSLKNHIQLLFCTSYPTKDNLYEYEINEGDNWSETIVYFPYHRLKIIRFYRKILGYYFGLKRLKAFDIIQVHVFFYAGVLAAIIGFLHHKKVILTENSTQFFQMTKLQSVTFQLFKNFIHQYVPVSDRLKDEYIKLGVDANNIKTVFNPIDIDIFKPNNVFDSEKFRFLHVSKFDIPRKNVEGILMAFHSLSPKYPNLILRIIGDGDIQWLQQCIEKLNIDQTRIEIYTTIENDKLYRYYQEANCFILFSYAENNPLVLLEALSSGLAVISSDAGNSADFINQTNGIVVKKGDVLELKNAMEDIYLNYSKYDKQKIRNSIIDKISYASVSCEFNNIYHNIIDPKYILGENYFTQN